MKVILFATVVFWFGAANAQSEGAGWKIVERKDAKQLDILYNGKRLTSYCYYDSLRKPILFPVNTLSGIEVTRGYPVEPHPGDHVDHPHHTGVWMNYENVSNINFWATTATNRGDKQKGYGRIRHREVKGIKASPESAKMRTLEVWETLYGAALLSEQTDFEFRQTETEFIIDRTTKLTALENEVNFRDVKDGFLAFRVASELEMPSNDTLEFVDGKGKTTKVSGNQMKGTGMYRSNTGLKGDSVWGTRGRWCVLTGEKSGHAISIAIIDHPLNPGYPTYWHARGYGLFAANPLGQEFFSQQKERLALRLAPGESAIFRYRIVIASEKTSSDYRMNELADEFAHHK